jgi:uncharacterized protein YjcR
MSNQNAEEYSFEDYPLGVNEIAEVLGVKPSTVSQWQQRYVLPKPDASINKGRTKLWKTKTIIDWANATGRNNSRKDYEQSKEQIKNMNKVWNVKYGDETMKQWDVWSKFNAKEEWTFSSEEEE